MNKVVLAGRLTRDPELNFTAGSGLATCKFTLAVNRMKKKDGTQEADFINCTAFGKVAEIIAQYVAKGHQFLVAGRIQTGSYMNKESVRVYTTEVIVEDFNFIQGKTDGVQSSPANSTNEPSYGNDVTPVESEYIPF